MIEFSSEKRDLNIKGIVIFLVGLSIIIAVVLLISHLIIKIYSFKLSEGKTTTAFAATPGSIPPQPRLQAHEREDYEQYLKEENEKLNSYGWADKKTGKIHIPIERAKELILK